MTTVQIQRHHLATRGGPRGVVPPDSDAVEIKL